MGHKNKRLGNNISSSKRRNGFDLSEDLLVEILKRLPFESLMRFQIVSNRWYDLISDVRRSFKKPWAFVYLHPPASYANTETSRKLKSFTSSTCENPFLKTSLPYLPNVLRNPGVTIAASFNDMILFKSSSFNCNTYYICNPVTKKYLVLPPPSVKSRFYKHCCLICEPSKLSSEFRFRVVVATCVDLLDVHNKNLLMEIYSSETGSWTRHNIPRSNTPCCGSLKKLVPGCGQILMWVHPECHDSSSVIFDPFKAPKSNLIEAHSIGIPSNHIQKAPMDVFPSQDRILLCQTPLIDRHSDPALSVWELNAEFIKTDEPSWKLVHRVAVPEMEGGTSDEIHPSRMSLTASFLKNVANYQWPYYTPGYQVTCVGFNPLDANVMFLLLTKDRDDESSCLAIYDMRTKAISEVPEEQMPDIDSRYELFQALLGRNPRPLLFPFVELSNPTLF